MMVYRTPRISNRRMKVTIGVLSLATIILIWMSFYRHKAQKCNVSYQEKCNVSYQEKCNVSYQEKVTALEAKILRLEMDSQKKRNIIEGYQANLKAVTNTDLIDAKEDYSYTADILIQLKNISGDFNYVKPEAKPQCLPAATSYDIMPHLMRHPRARCLGFQIMSPRLRSEIDVVIGIPTVKRDKENYLPETITSLIHGMTPEEHKKTLIVVYIGEACELSFIVDTAYELNVLFEPYFGQMIEVISPTKFWYPDFDSIDPSLGDSRERTQWRTKQNLDAVFLMSYAQNKGAYYLMLEDDVLAKEGYMTAITKFTSTETISNPNWFYIRFCNIGGIGELFKMNDLKYFSAYLQVFYQNLPIDWLMELFIANRVCGFEKGNDECNQLKGTVRPSYKPSLFEHTGLFSSLRGKMQQVKPIIRKGKKTPLFYPHDNPPVRRIVSSIELHKEHSVERAYAGDDFFWGIKPRANDTIEFWFDPAVQLNKFFFRTGNMKKMTDIIRQGVVEVLPVGHNNFIYMQEFDEFGICEGNIDPKIGELLAIQIRILENMKQWIIISEIELTP